MTKILLLPATHGLPALYCQQSPNFYARRPDVQLIVIHDVEGSYESGIVTFMTDRRIIGSQRILFGSDADGRLGHKAGHVEVFNDRSIGVELAGFTAKGFDAHELQAMARKRAYLLHRFNLPARSAQHGGSAAFMISAVVRRPGTYHARSSPGSADVLQAGPPSCPEMANISAMPDIIRPLAKSSSTNEQGHLMRSPQREALPPISSRFLRRETLRDVSYLFAIA